jgi:Peptidase inhibitor family I36
VRLPRAPATPLCGRSGRGRGGAAAPQVMTDMTEECAMRRNRVRSFLFSALALATVSGVVPTVAAAAPSSAPAAAPAQARAYNCQSGWFCIYDGWNGSGTRCRWSQAKKANTADDCSFIQRGRKVLSVWNGTGHRVQYYRGTNYQSRIGSTTAVHGGNLQGNYQIRSFRPQ